MSADTTTALSNADDILRVLDLDRAAIQSINIHHENNSLLIDLLLLPKAQVCPLCGSPTSKVKGYVFKRINHSVLINTPCIINYRARRYICPVCGKTFYEKSSFAHLGSKNSSATVLNVLLDLKDPAATFTSVAKKHQLSPSSVANLFDKHVDISRRPLPEYISIDEAYAFKSEDSNYICVLLDYKDQKIIDILPSRHKADLIEYLSRIPREERCRVKAVSYDLWQTYRIVSKLMFPNAYRTVDKFHVLQDLSRRVTKLRTTVMNEWAKKKNEAHDKIKDYKELKKPVPSDILETFKEAKKNYYLLKKFHWMLFSDNPDLIEPNRPKKYNSALEMYANYYDLFNMLLKCDQRLEQAIDLKDRVHRFYKECDELTAKAELEELIIEFRKFPFSYMADFSKTLTQWKPEIINSFIKIDGKKTINNGRIESKNKAIKTIKLHSNGYTNWNRFRNRVLYCLNTDTTFKI